MNPLVDWSLAGVVHHPEVFPEEAHVRRDAEPMVGHGYDVDVICLKRKGQKAIRSHSEGNERHELLAGSVIILAKAELNPRR